MAELNIFVLCLFGIPVAEVVIILDPHNRWKQTMILGKEVKTT